MCGNDQTALGAKVAAETDQAYAGVVIYGVDGSPDLKKELQKSDDIIVGTAAQRPITLGKCSKISIPGAGWGKDKRADL
jgi:ribose transport system substrate-binding protein